MKNKLLERYLRINNTTMEKFAEQCGVELCALQKVADCDMSVGLDDVEKIVVAMGISIDAMVLKFISCATTPSTPPHRRG